MDSGPRAMVVILVVVLRGELSSGLSGIAVASVVRGKAVAAHISLRDRRWLD